MSHQHSHSHAHHGHSHIPAAGADYLNRAFMWGIILNLVYVAVEFTAGWAVDSLALMSDAGHNLSDVVSLALAMLAFRLSRQKATRKYTYGRKKSTVIVSLANASILLVAVGMIFFESVRKFMEPQPVEGGIIAWVAGAGIVVNAFTAWLFVRHRKSDLNVRGAYLHMVADALVSVGVVVSGIVIHFTGWYVIDPAIGVVVAVIIFLSTWGLLRDSVRLSLDGVPREIDLGEVMRRMTALDDDIVEVHHIHVWPLSTTENALTAHVVMRSMERAAEVKRRIKEELAAAGISHATLELEYPGEHPAEENHELA